MNQFEVHATVIECPMCGLLSPPGSLRCDCGYLFAKPILAPGPDDPNEKVKRRRFIKHVILMNLGIPLWVWFMFFLTGMSVRLAVVVGLIYLLVANGSAWFSWRFRRPRLFIEPKRPERTWSDVLPVLTLAMLWGVFIYPKLSHGDHAGFKLGTICTAALVGLTGLGIFIDRNERKTLQP